MIAPFKYTFSFADNSISNPAPSVNNWIFFLSTTTSPLEGFKAPDIIFNRVDFPEPFVPIIPTISPR